MIPPTSGVSPYANLAIFIIIQNTGIQGDSLSGNLVDHYSAGKLFRVSGH